MIETMTSRPSSATFLLCSLLLTACEVPPPEQPEQAEVAPSDTPADTAADTIADTSSEQEPLPADSAIIRLDASDPDLGVWRDRGISGDPPREPGPIQVGSVLTFFGLPIARTAEDLVAGEVEVAFLGAGRHGGWGSAGRARGRPRSAPCGAAWAAWRRWCSGEANSRRSTSATRPWTT